MANITVGVGKDYTNIRDAVANASTVDGDTLLIDAGTYSEDVIVSKALTLSSVSGSTDVVIDGDASGFYFVNITTTGAATFNNIEFSYKGTHPNGVGFNGVGAIITFNDCTFTVNTAVLTGVEVGEIYASADFNDCIIDVSANLTKGSNQNQFIRIAASVSSPTTWDGCTITFSGATYGGLVKMEGDSIASVVDSTISFDTIDASGGFIWMTDGSLVFTGNTVSVTDAANIETTILMSTNRNGYLIGNNTFTSAATVSSVIISDSATSLSNETRRIYDNSFDISYGAGHVMLIGGEGDGDRATTYCDDTIIERNYIMCSGTPVSFHAILFGNSARGIIRNNYLANCPIGISIRGGVVSSGWVYGNILINPAGTNAQSITAKAVDWAYITNNTVYVPAVSGTNISVVTVSPNTSGVTKNSTNVVVKNNIIYATTGADLKEYIEVLANCAVGFDSNYNIFAGRADAATGTYYTYDGTNEALAAWQSRLLDVNSLTSDPAFIDGVNCIPKYTSPAIDFGDADALPSGLKLLSPLSRYDDNAIYTDDGNTNSGAVKYIGNYNIR